MVLTVQAQSVSWLADQLERDVVVRPGNQSGFTVFSDDPIDKELDHALHPDEKVQRESTTVPID